MAADSEMGRDQAAAAVPALRRSLDDPDWDVRAHAAEALGIIGADPQTTVPALIQHLRDKDEDVRERIVEALGRIGREPQSAVPVLISALTDDSGSIRSLAAGALANFGKDAQPAVPTLITLLQDVHYDHRADVARTLGVIGLAAEQSIPALLQALHDSDHFVAATAATALAQMGRNQTQVAAVAARLIGEELGERSDWVRAQAAIALGRLGADAEGAIPILSKFVGTVDASGYSANCADAIVAIAAALRDAHRTDVISVLQAAKLAMEHSENGYVRTQALELSDTIRTLEARRASNPKDLLAAAISGHPWIASAIGAYNILAVGLIGLLWLRPAVLYRIGSALEPFPAVTLPGWAGGIQISFAQLILVGFFDRHDRVLDAWVTKNIDTARARLEESEPVRKCASRQLPAVILNGVTTPRLAPQDLQPAFERSRTCVVIHGDLGSGKLRLACEIARWGMNPEQNERLRKNLMVPIIFEKGCGQATDKNEHPLIVLVREQLQVLDIEPPSPSVIGELLRRQRLLVIVNRFPKLDDETREIIRPASPDFPVHALVVTSCVEESLGGVRRTMIRTIVPA
jgi:HEAT repeat protein